MQVSLQQAITQLKNGNVVAIPTETVYGLAADASNDAALQQIYAIKQRPADNPLIVHIADASQVQNWASAFSPLAQKLAAAFWPGPFTIVLPAKSTVSQIVRGGQPTVALRVPAHPLALELLQKSGLGLAAPSANKFTQLSPTTAAHVASGLGNAVAVLDGGACKVGIESTIVSVINDDWQLLRLGMITETEIEKIAGKTAIKAVKTKPKDFIKVPGQHLLHYSPKTPIQLFKDIENLQHFAAKNANCVALIFAEKNLVENKQNLREVVTLPLKATIVAEQLYNALHTLDALQAAWILALSPPQQMDWLAINDRLTRAAHRQL